jgi:aspartyl-tRNA(Asn)/glutamyl-tRNA(Gln) amidotransferase subunit A
MEQLPSSVVPRSVVESVRMLRDREVSSEELTRIYLDRIERVDGDLGAFVARFEEECLAAARDADVALAAGERGRLLLGVPMAIKDIIATREAETRCNSDVRNPPWTARRDSAVVTRLRRAGAVILGKLTTNEYALGGPDPTKAFPIPHNPWNLHRTAGGSSSGSGVAVAAGLCAAALGTDTGGSIRLPAAFNGVTGMVPTFGIVPSDGLVPLAWSMDRVGPMARTAEDCAVVFAALAGRTPASRLSDAIGQPDLTGIRLAIVREPLAVPGADLASADVLDAAEQVLADLGAEAVTRELPLYAETAAAAKLTLFGEAFDVHRELLAAHWRRYGSETRLALVRGAFVSSADYMRAQRVRTVATQAMTRIFADVDLIVMPTATIGAPERAGFAEPGILEHVHTFYWSATGYPVVALPAGFTADGLPLGLQFVARAGADDRLLMMSQTFQSVTDHHLRVPAVVAS